MLETLEGGRLALGPRLGEFEGALADRLGVDRVSAVSSGTAALHLSVRASGLERGRPGGHLAVLLRGLGQLRGLRGRGAGLLRHRPAHAEHRPRGRLRRDRRPHRRPAAGPHLRLPGRHADVRGAGLRARAVDRRGRVRGPGSGARRRAAVGARGNLATFGFYPNKQITTGEGGAVVCPSPAVAARDRLRAKPGPRTRHGLARPRPAGLQLPPRRPQLRARRRAGRAARPAAGRPRPGCRAVRRGAGRDRGARAAVPGLRRRPPLAGSSTWCSCRAGWTATPSWSTCASAAWTPSPTCRRSTSTPSTASGSGIGRGSSRCARTSPPGRWRCRSSARCPRARWPRSPRRWGRCCRRLAPAA